MAESRFTKDGFLKKEFYQRESLCQLNNFRCLQKIVAITHDCSVVEDCWSDFLASMLGVDVAEEMQAWRDG